VVVNVYARTRLTISLRPEVEPEKPGAPLSIDVRTDTLRGVVARATGFARLIAPSQDLPALVGRARLGKRVANTVRLPDSKLGVDAGRVLAILESRRSSVGAVRDEEVRVVQHDGPLHVHVTRTDIPGPYHVGILVEGTYVPGAAASRPGGHGDHTTRQPAAGAGESFTRLLSVSVSLPAPPAPKPVARAVAQRTTPRRSVARRRKRR
jgi:hypothetical protein